jgi:hypothetical protein
LSEEIAGFDWDAANVGYTLRHAVTPFEVEEVVPRPHITVPARTVKGDRKLFRTVTAYEMNTTERKRYAGQID